MTRRYAAAHETGHAFPWFHAHAPLERIRIFPQPLMGGDEWEGETDPGAVAGIDGIYAIMAAYAGPLAEAKLRIEDSSNVPVRFDYDNPEVDFVSNHPSNADTGTTNITFLNTETNAVLSQELSWASIHSDVQAAYNRAANANRTDLLGPLCRKTRQLLDLAAVWHTIKRFASLLENDNDISSPVFHVKLESLFEEETAIDAHSRWLSKGKPQGEDLAHWFTAQGYA